MNPVVFDQVDDEICMAAVLDYEATAAATTPATKPKSVKRFIEVKDPAIIRECKVSWSKQVIITCIYNNDLSFGIAILGHVDVAL